MCLCSSTIDIQSNVNTPLTSMGQQNPRALWRASCWYTQCRCAAMYWIDTALPGHHSLLQDSFCRIRELREAVSSRICDVFAQQHRWNRIQRLSACELQSLKQRLPFLIFITNARRSLRGRDEGCACCRGGSTGAVTIAVQRHHMFLHA